MTDKQIEEDYLEFENVTLFLNTRELPNMKPHPELDGYYIIVTDINIEQLQKDLDILCREWGLENYDLIDYQVIICSS